MKEKDLRLLKAEVPERRIVIVLKRKRVAGSLTTGENMSLRIESTEC
jgi:hypothetical protein